ncbi:MAG: DNA topoisomerase [Oscillospiraceae bacterium]|nr:DNA topoisomerase [Oscillospiraceae bacterium]
MVVIYAEKSSLAKAIAGALGAGKRIPLADEPTVGYYRFTFKGEEAVLCHGVGHLAQLVPAKSYDEKYIKWDLNIYPCIPEVFNIAAKAVTIKCIKAVKAFLDKADWAVNATDPDREGELIFAYVCDVCKFHKPIQRAWIEDLTEEKIRKAFNNLKAHNEILSDQTEGCAADLQKAGRARDIADWLIGNNLTVAATRKYGGYDNLISVGRVQTPTLAMVVNREKQILSHVKTPFWKVTAEFTAAKGTFEADHEHGNYDNETVANTILSACIGHDGTVTDKQVKHKTVSAPLLYNTTQLQIAASKKLGWESDKTMNVMQSLYEHKLMSYPRTSSEHLTQAMEPEVKLTIQKILLMPEYNKFALPEEKWSAFSSRHFDDKKVGSHPAIIPTVNVPENLNDISDDEKELYDLLAKSIIRIIYPKAELDESSVIVSVNGSNFKATGSVITNIGWYTVDAKPENKNTLPAIEIGDKLSGSYKIKKGETEPPKRFTEAALLAAMELAGANIEDEEIRTLMKLQKKGLGTDATRVAILKGLFSKGYLERKGKTIIPTEKGIYLIDNLAVEDIKSADMTGEWEKQLNDIACGKADFNSFVSMIKETTMTWYKEIAGSSSGTFVSEKEAKMICPLCGKQLRHMKWGYGCSGYQEGCKFSLNSEICSKKITEPQALALLTKGKTNIIKGFTGKSGRSFDAALKLDRQSGKINFEFSNK